jgi:hypothetical protein
MNNYRTTLTELLAIEEQAALEQKTARRQQLEAVARQAAALYLEQTAGALEVELPTITDGPLEWRGEPGRARYVLLSFDTDLALELEANAAGKFTVVAMYGRCHCGAWTTVCRLTIPGDFARGIRRQAEKPPARTVHRCGLETDGSDDYCDGIQQWNEKPPPPPLRIETHDVDLAADRVLELEAAGYVLEIQPYPVFDRPMILIVARHPEDGSTDEPF